MNLLGDFQIEVFLDDNLIEDKPNIARAFDVNKVIIYDFPTSSIVDASTYFISKLFICFVFFSPMNFIDLFVF